MLERQNKWIFFSSKVTRRRDRRKLGSKKFLRNSLHKGGTVKVQMWTSILAEKEFNSENVIFNHHSLFVFFFGGVRREAGTEGSSSSKSSSTLRSSSSSSSLFLFLATSRSRRRISSCSSRKYLIEGVWVLADCSECEVAAPCPDWALTLQSCKCWSKRTISQILDQEIQIF